LINKLKIYGNHISRFHDFLSKICFSISGILIFIMSLMISCDVLMRYFFVRPTIWVTDFSKYILCYSTFLSASWIYKIGGHVRITIVIERLSSKMRYFLKIINYIIGIFICLVLVWSGFYVVWQLYYKNIIIVRPIIVQKWMIVIVIPIGFLVLLIYFIKNIVECFASAKSETKNNMNRE